MSRERLAAAIALVSILLVACSVQKEAPAQKPETAQSNPGPGASQSGQYQPSDELQVNQIKEFKFPGGVFRDGKVRLDPGTKVEPGAQKNTVMLKPASGSGTTFNCFCVIEGGECWALSTPNPDGSIDLGCVSANCVAPRPPFCFQEIDCPDQGFKIRMAVAGMKSAEPQ
ncbi:MAG TPA: hypothetical protein VFW45_09725 [Candidatus Polarisedimenticolia bacterium]|nr:hypothetical protein [Candidatus Polarisedimenticolia bacterium]